MRERILKCLHVAVLVGRMACPVAASTAGCVGCSSTGTAARSSDAGGVGSGIDGSASADSGTGGSTLDATTLPTGGGDSGAKGDGGYTGPPDAGPPVAPCTVAANCIGRFNLPGTQSDLPYYSTYPATTPLPQITDVVVFIHGLNRDASSDFTTVVTAGQKAGRLTSTLIITPFFQALVSASGASCSGPTNTPLANDLVWTCNAWSDGLAATNNSSVTSYGALDALVTSIEQSFPNLARITVAGFSAGGQFTQRYAAANTVDRGTTGVPFRYVVSDPSSYLYLDSRRPVNAANCTTTGCPDGFAPFADAGGCPNFNDWKYGTLALAGAAANFTPTELEQAYTSRRIEYLLGDQDNGPTTAADYAQLDVTCAGNAEGPYRYQRGLAFYAYATSLLDAGGSTVASVPGCAHSPSCVFQSDAGIEAVFGP